MIHPNGHDSSTATIPTPAPSEAINTTPEPSSTLQQPIDIATRARLRAKQQFQQNRFVIIGAGALVVALLIFCGHVHTAQEPGPKDEDRNRGGEGRADANRKHSGRSKPLPDYRFRQAFGKRFA